MLKASTDKDKNLRIMIIGAGGRESALAFYLSSSQAVSDITCVNGNAGMRLQGFCCRDISMRNLEDISRMAAGIGIDMVVVGSEEFLVSGISDYMARYGICTFGADKKSAILEGSKIWMKEFCRRNNILTANFSHFDNFSAAKAYIEGNERALVVKTDGLAQGKGVIVGADKQEAIEAAYSMLVEKRFGEAGKKILIEEKLCGEELSFFALSDGKHILPLAAARDYKRVFSGDKGANTGGMGAYSSPDIISPETEERITKDIIEKAFNGMRNIGRNFSGVLFAGLMLSGEKIYLLEFNIRFGDPECQVILPRLRTDLGQILRLYRRQELDKIELKWDNRCALCLVIANQGYPSAYKKGGKIRNISEAEKIDGVKIFHAGSKLENGDIIASGGRVLNVVALADSVEKARKIALKAAQKIEFKQGFYRQDIGS